MMLRIWLGAALVLSACSPICEPGRSVSCACVDGTSSSQTCAADGRSWGACGCRESDAGTLDAGAVDAGSVDAGTLDAISVDGGPVCQWWIDSETPSDGRCEGDVAVNCGADGYASTPCGAGSTCRVVDVLANADPSDPGSFAWAICVPDDATECELAWDGTTWAGPVTCDAEGHQVRCDLLGPPGAEAMGLGSSAGITSAEACPASTRCRDPLRGTCEWEGDCAAALDSFCLPSGLLVSCTGDASGSLHGDVVACPTEFPCTDATACGPGGPRADCLPPEGSLVPFPSDERVHPVELCDPATYGGAWGEVCDGPRIRRCDVYCRGTDRCECAISPGTLCSEGTRCTTVASGDHTCAEPGLDCAGQGDTDRCVMEGSGPSARPIAVRCTGDRLAEFESCGRLGLACAVEGGVAGCVGEGVCEGATGSCTGDTLEVCCGPDGHALTGAGVVVCVPGRPVQIACPAPTHCSTSPVAGCY